MAVAASQIRFTKTFEISEMLADIKYLYRGLSEAELVKLALSKLWTKEVDRDENGLTKRQQKDLEEAIASKDFYGPFEGDEAIEFLDSLSPSKT